MNHGTTAYYIAGLIFSAIGVTYSCVLSIGWNLSYPISLFSFPFLLMATVSLAYIREELEDLYKEDQAEGIEIIVS